jgi:hypothetical protein
MILLQYLPFNRSSHSIQGRLEAFFNLSMLHLLYLVTAQCPSLSRRGAIFAESAFGQLITKLGVVIYISFTQLSTAIRNFQGLVGLSILPRHLEKCVKFSHSTVITSDSQLKVTPFELSKFGLDIK